MINSILSLFVFIGGVSHAASTADYYKCYNRVGGEWLWGRVPAACDASAFGSDSVVHRDYASLIFADEASRTTERNRYMQELYPAIRDAAEIYFKKRKPNASAEELAQWTLLVHTTAAQESRVSHYRIASDSRLKMIRGDVGHGHGMMQIDDRSHFTAIEQGIAWNLVSAMTYGMDILYQGWERAPSQTCVGSATNWKARIRSAWAAYNGGPGSICRWTNANSAWAANDKGFLDMYNTRGWLSYVANPNRAASIDIECLMEKREDCGAPPVPTDRIVPQTLYRLADGRNCILFDGQLRCVTDQRDAVCLNGLQTLNSMDPVTAPEALLASYVKVNDDRHSLCRHYAPSLVVVGEFVKAVTTINVRATPGGGLLGTFPINEVAEVLDFEVRNHPTADRYYKIKVGTVTGFIYAGTEASQATWVVKTAAPVSLPATVARVGEKVQIVNASGINLRSTPGGTKVGAVPKGVTLTVKSNLVQGTNNEIYYQVTYSSKTGFIYSGALLPSDSTALWTKRIK